MNLPETHHSINMLRCSAEGLAVEAFAVEDTAVQLVWSGVPLGGLEIEVAGRVITVDESPPMGVRRLVRGPAPLGLAGGGPGAAILEGLDPSTTYNVVLAGRVGRGRRSTVTTSFTTLAPPPGPLLARFATISDLHLGERGFGFAGRFEDLVELPAGSEPYPLRAARAAITEAGEWGAELLVVKGDMTRDSSRGEFETAAALLGSAPVPVEAILGNHDVRRRCDGSGILAAAGVAVDTAATSRVRDLPGVRIIVGHTADPHHHDGHVSTQQRHEWAALAADASRRAGGAAGGVVLALHHPPQPWPIPTAYPPGITRGDSVPLVKALARANPATLIVAGHTHRNRRYRAGPLPVAEIGSTKDYPGVWAGYAVHEGGIRQVVRRIARPDVLAWTEATGWALGGLWGRWAPGRLDDRCWSWAWPG
ncbi:MAG: metallophosphoesterase family protein [Acidimicrobiales bacterium]